MREKKKENRGGTRVLPADQLSLFCTEMVMLLRSGQTVFDGIRARAAMDAKNGKAPKGSVFSLLAQYTTEGCSLGEAMEKTKVFPADFTGLVQIGEESGSLEEVLDALAAHYRRDSETAAEIRSALRYPILTLCMMAVILGILTREVFPVFTRIYESLGGGLPQTAAASIAIGSVCAKAVAVLEGVLLLMMVIGWALGRSVWGMKLLSGIRAHLPFFGRLNARIAAARTADSLAIMLQAGYDIDESISRISQALADPAAAKKLARCRGLLEGDGENPPLPLGEALAGCGMWNELEGRMIQSGASSGNLDYVLKFVSDTGMDEAAQKMARAVSLIEPVMVAITAILIGSILLSVILPLSGIMAAIG